MVLHILDLHTLLNCGRFSHDFACFWNFLQNSTFAQQPGEKVPFTKAPSVGAQKKCVLCLIVFGCIDALSHVA